MHTLKRRAIRWVGRFAPFVVVAHLVGCASMTVATGCADGGKLRAKGPVYVSGYSMPRRYDLLPIEELLGNRGFGFFETNLVERDFSKNDGYRSQNLLIHQATGSVGSYLRFSVAQSGSPDCRGLELMRQTYPDFLNSLGRDKCLAVTRTDTLQSRYEVTRESVPGYESRQSSVYAVRDVVRDRLDNSVQAQVEYWATWGGNSTAANTFALAVGVLTRIPIPTGDCSKECKNHEERERFKQIVRPESDFRRPENASSVRGLLLGDSQRDDQLRASLRIGAAAFVRRRIVLGHVARERVQEAGQSIDIASGERPAELHLAHDAHGILEALHRTVVEVRRGLRDVAQHGHAVHVLVRFLLGRVESTLVDGR